MAYVPKTDINQLVSENQTIKIVPSLEDSLRAIGLNFELDKNAQLWFRQLKVTWQTWKKSATVEEHIFRFFSSIEDPHRIALVFTVKSEDFKDCKPKSLPYFIIETLHKWAQKNGANIDNSLKLPAFKIATSQRNQHFLSLTVKTYQVNTIKHEILPVVKQLINNDNCRQASQIVVAMELFDDVSIEELLFPLIMQDKINMIDEYLSECPSQIYPLLQFLDKFLDKNFNIREYVQQYIEDKKISQIKYDKLHYKPLGKLVARLCNKYNIPIETCKNLSKNRTTGGLRYLVHQRYQEHKVSSSVWDDLVKDSLRQNADSGKEFIDLLVDFDKKEALKWAEYLNIAENDLPLALRDVNLQDANPEEEIWDTPIQPVLAQSYYKLSIPAEQIVMIDTAEKFYDLMMSNFITSNVVSIDCEWKPSFGATQSRVALIQIATQSHVYLIDALLLNRQEYASFWYTFHKNLLDNAEIIKLGFGLDQDLKEMKSMAGLSNIKVKGEGLLDLSLLWKNLIDSGLTLPGNSDTGGSSLSSLVQSCFGWPLEKSEQCSNWELRPLRSTQILYAALDAHVLLEIYFYLQNLCQEQDIDFEEICNDVMLERKKKFSRKTKPAEKIILDKCQTTLAKDIRFLVDPNLSHMMLYLRYCGIDTTVISTSMLWHDVINQAISEDRVIVLPKLKCSPTPNFPQSSILDVGKGTMKEQLHKVFFNFNISVKESDLWNRCVNCNSNNIKKLMPNEVSNLCTAYINMKNVRNMKTNYQRDSDDDEADYKDFLSDSDCDEEYFTPVRNINTTNKSCTTSKGAVVEINDVHKVIESQKSAILCEDCGKLLWDEDPIILTASNMIASVTKVI